MTGKQVPRQPHSQNDEEVGHLRRNRPLRPHPSPLFGPHAQNLGG